jgi:hypothetical protein
LGGETKGAGGPRIKTDRLSGNRRI